jgi:hypothetical protein
LGQHIALSYMDGEGNEQGRPYTPTSSDVDQGRTALQGGVRLVTWTIPGARTILAVMN